MGWGQVAAPEPTLALPTQAGKCHVCHTVSADGSTIWEFLDSYLLAAEQGRWRILGDVVHD